MQSLLENSDDKKKVLGAFSATTTMTDIAGRPLPIPFKWTVRVAEAANKIEEHPSDNRAQKFSSVAADMAAEACVTAGLTPLATLGVAALVSLDVPAVLVAGVGTALVLGIGEIAEAAGNLAGGIVDRAFELPPPSSTGTAKASLEPREPNPFANQISYPSEVNLIPFKSLEQSYLTNLAELAKPYVWSLLGEQRQDSALNSFGLGEHLRVKQQINPLEGKNLRNPFPMCPLSPSECVRSAWAMVRLSRYPDAHRMYAEVQSELRTQAIRAMMNGECLGLGYNLSYIEFCSILRNEGLATSYNSFGPKTVRAYAMKFLQDIGGVASRIGLIEDLLNSDFQARVDLEGITYCYPVGRFFNEDVDLVELCNQMQTIHLKDKDRAFVSIHFNREGEIFTVIPPALKGTLIERAVVLLDYWMKGFLNGGIFNEEFITNWHQTANRDEGYLRQNLIDLKRYCRDDAQAKQLRLSYYSLRELMSRFDISHIDDTVNISGEMPYQTSFRIIAKLGSLQRHDNLLFPKPEYDVEYTIEETEQYKQFLAQHKAHHGQYPADYQLMQQCTRDFAAEIKRTFLKLPFLQDYLALLGLATATGYIDMTLEAMGKAVVFQSKPQRLHQPFPEILPPIPVQYFKKLPITLTFQEILNSMPAALVDEALNSVFTELQIEQCPVGLLAHMQEHIETLLTRKIQAHLAITTAVELNDYEVNNLVQRFTMLLMAFCKEVDTRVKNTVARSLYFLTPEDAEAAFIFSLPSADQIPLAKAKVDHFIASLMALPVLSEAEFLAALPQDERDEARTAIIQKLRNDIASQEAQQQSASQQFKRLDIFNQDHNRIRYQAFQQQATANINRWKTIIEALEVGADTHLTEEMTSYCTTLYRTILKQLQVELHAKLDAVVDTMEHMHAKILAVQAPDEFSRMCNYYMHMRRGFTNKDLIRETGDQFELMGGCSVALPALQTTPLSADDSLLATITQSLPTLDTQTGRIQYITHDSQRYAVWHLPVENKKVLDNTLREEFRYLDKLMAQETDDLLIDDDLVQLTEPVDEHGAYVIHYASTGLSLTQVQHLLKADPSQALKADDFGFLPVHMAAREGRADLVAHFIDLYPKLLQVESKKGITPLALAVQVGEIEVVRLLLKRGASAHIVLHNGLFPLHHSIENNFPDIALLLLQYLTPAQASYAVHSGMTPLHLAIRNELKTVALALIKHGVCLTSTLKANGYLPLHLAIEQGNIDLVNEMLSNPPNPTLFNFILPSGDTLLHVAVNAGLKAEPVVQLLVERGASVGMVNKFNQTPLARARVLRASRETLDLLSRHASPFNTSSNEADCVDELVIATRNNDLETIKRITPSQDFLSSLYAQVIRQDHSLPNLAAHYGHFDLVTYFQVTNQGYLFPSTEQSSLLNYAVMHDEVGFVRAKHQISRFARFFWQGLAAHAAASGAVKCLQLLLQKLAMPQSVMQSLLEAAVTHQRVAVVELLLAIKYPKQATFTDNQAGNFQNSCRLKQNRFSLLAA